MAISTTTLATNILVNVFTYSRNQLSPKVYTLWSSIWRAFPNKADTDILIAFRAKPARNKNRFQQLLERKGKSNPEFLISVKNLLGSLDKKDRIPFKYASAKKRSGSTHKKIILATKPPGTARRAPNTSTKGHIPTTGSEMRPIAKKKIYGDGDVVRIPAKKFATKSEHTRQSADTRAAIRERPFPKPHIHRGGGPAAKKKAYWGKAAAKKKVAKKSAVRKPVAKSKSSSARSKSNQNSTEKITCFTKVSMEQQVLLKKITPVNVTISRQLLQRDVGKASARGSGEVDKTKPLTIQIQSILNVKIKGKKKEEINVPQEGKTQSLTFNVIPLHEGKCKLSIDVWQGQIPVCSVEVQPVCVTVKSHQRKIRPQAITPSVQPFPEQVIQLRIRERQEGKISYYDYELNAPALNVFNAYSSPPIKVSRERYVAQLYEEIENLWATVADSPRQFKNELRNFGAHLFDALFPEELQQVLYDNSRKIRSIQVISSEPFIPWELVLVKNPKNATAPQPKDKFLGELGLTRWLHGWSPTMNLVIGKENARYVIPQYLDSAFVLPAAMPEQAYLVKNFSAKEIKPDPVTIDRLLRKPGSFDLLHFCCHGEADTKNITYAKLRMLEKETRSGYQPAYLTQLSIEHCGTISKNATHRPIVVLNACQSGRSGNSLSGYGGFANAFLKAGAGAFIGSHWSIEDTPALSFITSLYSELLLGKNLAEATIAARKTASKEKDATWISYVVYGHPFAVLQTT